MSLILKSYLNMHIQTHKGNLNIMVCFISLCILVTIVFHVPFDTSSSLQI